LSPPAAPGFDSDNWPSMSREKRKAAWDGLHKRRHTLGAIHLLIQTEAERARALDLMI